MHVNNEIIGLIVEFINTGNIITFRTVTHFCVMEVAVTVTVLELTIINNTLYINMENGTIEIVFNHISNIDYDENTITIEFSDGNIISIEK